MATARKPADQGTPGPRAPMPWLRIYSADLNDQAIQSLAPDMFKVYYNFKLHANAQRERGRVPTNYGAIAFALRMEALDCEFAINALIRQGLICIEGTALVPRGWDDENPPSDNAAQRVADWRNRKRQAAIDAGETPRGPGRPRKQQASGISPTDSLIAGPGGVSTSEVTQGRPEQARNGPLQNPVTLPVIPRNVTSYAIEGDIDIESEVEVDLHRDSTSVHPPIPERDMTPRPEVNAGARPGAAGNSAAENSDFPMVAQPSASASQKRAVTAFNRWIAGYPERRIPTPTKGDLLKAYEAFLEVPPAQWPALSAATEHYSLSREVHRGYAKDASRFLLNGIWYTYVDGCPEPYDPAAEARRGAGRSAAAPSAPRPEPETIYVKPRRARATVEANTSDGGN
jgi:hypothetical protein